MSSSPPTDLVLCPTLTVIRVLDTRHSFSIQSKALPMPFPSPPSPNSFAASSPKPLDTSFSSSLETAGFFLSRSFLYNKSALDFLREIKIFAIDLQEALCLCCPSLLQCFLLRLCFGLETLFHYKLDDIVRCSRHIDATCHSG